MNNRNKVYEIRIDNADPRFISWVPVAVKDYGSEGSIPLNNKECPYNGEVSCVSGSGGSACGNYHGHFSSNVVRCMS